MTERSISGAPALNINLYATEVLRDSRAAFSRIRQAGPVVWLPRNKLHAIGRFDDVRYALRNDAVFRSGAGVAANPVANLVGRDTTLFSDDDVHTRRRGVLMRSLGAKALVSIQDQIDNQAAELIERLADGREFEAARDFASHLPVRIVADLVGVRKDHSRMLRWAAATFDTLGPANRRMLTAGRQSLGLFMYTRMLSPRRVKPGSWAASVFEARDKGQISRAEARSLVIDFVAPALDTTILASTHLLWCLARHPHTWDEIRGDPELAPRAVIENVRLASPVRCFTRTLAEDHAIGDVELRRGSRVALLFGSANLDETAFPEPERFALDRPNSVQLGWGHGAHTCVGLHLAKLEMNALLSAMIPRVRSVEAGEPERLINNTLQGISAMPARFAAV